MLYVDFKECSLRRKDVRLFRSFYLLDLFCQMKTTALYYKSRKFSWSLCIMRSIKVPFCFAKDVQNAAFVPRL